MNRIAVIDDSKAVQALLRDYFQIKGNFVVTSFFDGQEAVDFVMNNSQPQWDLILLDWEMPRLDGPATHLKFKTLLPQTPVVMMTTKNNPDDIVRMLDQGIADYLMKPFTPDILFSKLAPYCRNI
ncbi:MAG: response regulator transcription factor [Pseudobdellovibrionaceae bacterium]